MGNFSTSIKRLLSNKNTVTIIMVILGVVVLYLGYNYRVKQAIDPISVPYAKQEIISRTEINAEMIGYTDIPKSMKNSNKNLITNVNDILGKVVNFSNTIPEGSLFYTTAITTKENLPDSAFANIPDGYGVFSLKVNLETTLGNSIFPGNVIDLWVKTVDDNGLIVYGELISSIKVQAVKDSAGRHVFETTTESRIPASLLFYVPNDLFVLLNVADEINGLTIVPVPRNASYSANPNETQISSEYLREYINKKAVEIPDDNEYEAEDNQNVPEEE